LVHHGPGRRHIGTERFEGPASQTTQRDGPVVFADDLRRAGQPTVAFGTWQQGMAEESPGLGFQGSDVPFQRFVRGLSGATFMLATAPTGQVGQESGRSP
jgi:hypothetical protein